MGADSPIGDTVVFGGTGLLGGQFVKRLPCRPSTAVLCWRGQVGAGPSAPGEGIRL